MAVNHITPTVTENIPLGTRVKSPTGQLFQLNGTKTNKNWVKIPSNWGEGTDGNKYWSTAAPPTQTDTDGSAITTTISPGPTGDGTPDDKALRFPTDSFIDERSDFVFFQFGEYVPPFTAEGSNKAGAGNSFVRYNASTNLKQDARLKNIILPMPQDLGNDLQQGWAGKSFSALGRAAVQGVAGGDMSRMGDRLKDTEGSVQAITRAIQVNLLNKLPGVGGNLTIGDVTGATQGMVFNPNAELLYDQPELREIGMTFKLVPRNQPEAAKIQEIVRTFRLAAAPEWGGGDANVNIGDKSKKKSGDHWDEVGVSEIDAFDADNFMRVPNLCKFTFMQGAATKKQLIQFKPCAISRVAVNYTPDGTYATYSDGSPVAIELQLSFVETKVLFKQDIGKGF